MRGPCAAIQISGHLPLYDGRANRAFRSGKYGDSRLTSSPPESHSARMVAIASSNRATGFDQSTPYGSLPSRSPLPMPRMARPRVNR